MIWMHGVTALLLSKDVAKAALTIAFVGWSTSVAALPDWFDVRDRLAICIEREDDICIAQVAESVAAQLPSKFHDPSSDTDEQFAAPPLRLTLLSDLVVFHALRGNMPEAQRFYDLAYSERVSGRHHQAIRPVRSVERFVVQGYLRAGNASRFAAALNRTRDVHGQPSDFSEQVDLVSHVLINLPEAGKDFDPHAAGVAIAEWLASRPAVDDETAEQLLRAAAQSNVMDIARAIAARHDSASVSSAFAEEERKRQEQMERQKALFELATGPTPLRFFKALEATEAAQSKYALRQIQRGFNRVAMDLRKTDKLQELTPLLFAARDYAAGLRGDECRVILVLSAMSHAVAADDFDTLSALAESVPKRGATPWNNEKIKCGLGHLKDRAFQREMLIAVGLGEDGLNAFPSDLERSELGRGLLRAYQNTGPYLTQAQAAMLHERWAEVILDTTDSNPNGAILQTRFARQDGFDKAAFAVARMALAVGTSRNAETRKSTEVNGNVTFVKLERSAKREVVGLLDAFLGWRVMLRRAAAESRSHLP